MLILGSLPEFPRVSHKIIEMKNLYKKEKREQPFLYKRVNLSQKRFVCEGDDRWCPVHQG